MSTTPVNPLHVPDASALCLACGFCCDGTLHTYTVLQPQEVAPVQGLGAAVELIADRPGFRQPCPFWQDAACTIYARRPRVCAEYQCEVLRKYLAQQITWEQALAHVHTTQALLYRVRRHPAAPASFRALLNIIAQADDADLTAGGGLLDDDELLTTALALGIHLHRHFDPFADGSRTD